MHTKPSPPARIAAASWVVGVALAAGACARALPDADAAGPRAAAPTSENDVVARVSGQDVTLAELDARISGMLSELRQQEYDARRDALDDLIEERLVAAEARQRGVAPEQVLHDEVEAKAKAPTQEEIEAFYQANRSRIGDQPREIALLRVEQFLLRSRRAERRQAFRDELQKRAAVHVLLQPPRSDVPIPASAPALGPEDAPVTVVEFTDYQCPFCKRAQQTVETLLQRYDGRLRLVYLDFPLDIHARALPASKAARCAGDQGRFWDYHRNLLLEPGDYSRADFETRARGLGLDAALFGTCLDSDQHDATVRASVDEARRLGVSATPTFFINGRRMAGARPLEEFVRVIDEELERPPS